MYGLIQFCDLAARFVENDNRCLFSQNEAFAAVSRTRSQCRAEILV
jgi:hypothetical protein